LASARRAIRMVGENSRRSVMVENRRYFRRALESSGTLFSPYGARFDDDLRGGADRPLLADPASSADVRSGRW